MNSLDTFKTIDGKLYELIKESDTQYEIIRGNFVFHVCETLDMAIEKFYKIKEMFRIEGELAI